MADETKPDAATVAVADPPQEETKEKETNPESKEKTEKTKQEEKPGEEEPESPTANLKGFEVEDDGRISITVGKSKYFGKTADEAWDAMLKGQEEKDKSYELVAKERAELKARSSIREPEEEEEPLPPAPKQEDYFKRLFAEQGIDLGMAFWTRDDPRWRQYKDDKGLEDFQLSELRADIKQLKSQATQQFVADETAWLNRDMLRTDITPAVQDMVVQAGLDPEQFGKEYLDVLKEDAARDKYGTLSTAYILKAMNKKIIDALKAQGTTGTELDKKKAQLKEELEEKKKILASTARTSREVKTKTKEPKSIDEGMRIFTSWIQGKA
jgi:hypothetical protein